jgi:hypothetical protein
LSKVVDWVFSGDLRLSGGGRHVGGFGWGDVDGAFEEFALVEGGAGADEGDQVWGIDGSPAGLCGLDELVGHCQPGRARTRSLVTLVLKRTVAKLLSMGFVVLRCTQCSAGYL